MTVNISKPAVNLREELADLRKPTGIAGEAMLRAETPQEQFQLIGAGRRNLIINGGFDVWQRGTSFVDISSAYCADRWGIYFSSTSHITVTRQSFPTGHTEVEGNPKYYMRLDNTPDVDTTWMEFYQRIEDVNQFSGATVTVSFWVKASSAQSNNNKLLFTMNHGSGGSAQLSAVSDLFDISTTWEKKVVTVNLPSLYGRAVGTGSYMEFRMYQAALVAADTQYDIANVQLELGKVATPFEHRSYGEELALCQRYLYAINGGGHPSSTSAAYGRFISFAQGNNATVWFPSYPVQMRALPSLIATNVTSSTFRMFNYNAQVSASLSGISLQEGTTTSGQVVFTSASGISSGDTVSVRWFGNANASFQFDAEL